MKLILLMFGAFKETLKIGIPILVLFTACSTPQEAAVQNLIHMKREMAANQNEARLVAQSATQSISGRCLGYFAGESVSNRFVCQKVILKLINQEGVEVATARPKSSGEFSFMDLPQDKYRLDLSGKGTLQVVPQGWISAGQKVEVKVQLSR